MAAHANKNRMTDQRMPNVQFSNLGQSCNQGGAADRAGINTIAHGV